MLRYILSRLGYMVLTLWIIVTATFFLMHSLPGTPLKNEEKLPPLIRDQIMETYGLKDPLPVQYVNFMKRLVQGDFGQSLSYDGRSVTEMLLEGFEASAFIGAQALVFGVLVGLLLGVGAALRRGGWLDNVATVIAVGGISIPSFVLAALLSYWVGVKWQILPAGLWGTYEHTILPSLALSFTVIAQISRYVRTEMVEVMDQDYMKTAKAKGLGRQAIVFRHALRNALIPAITVLGPLAVNIITGSLIVETIFAVPGIGEFFVQSIQVNDYTLIMGVTIFYSILILATIFLVDILYGVIDPRIRLTGAKE
ncbi:ABC transporter permease [Thermoactinomyces intermedius]|jgi:oligopeptide transport system permease protein|uniref:ABC transporter permease n=1 Tax=Thermoactinomyces intermedius TaxID=2024 RepID=A0A8I1DF73_THEIN|nr:MULTISPECIES: ABC transporter permease [Thermoactinomyces]MBA4549230.1 ABC transporter permease [Thermoactinomyces intermedius]MBA4836175.1 ABC transporter permease [Thermoactinomyces intermedius]MBH8595754.1 ABC transporter permease [Thermoactinomyces intermedius]MBH8600834.1 ABC transporter permease [Thermoactinomyces sp. CICC 23799]